MKITAMEIIPVRVPYRYPEQSSVVDTAGVNSVLVRLTAEDGTIGWGESCTAASTEAIVAALRAAEPLVVGAGIWDADSVADRYYVAGRWRYQEMTAHLAFAGIDMAFLDLAGKSVGQPVYRLIGGLQRAEVDYFYYLRWGDPEHLREQCEAGVASGYSVFYLKVGKDPAAETRMLAVVRDTIGSGRRIRIDANQSWTLAEARHRIADWHDRFDLDFVEGPIACEPLAAMAELKAHAGAALCLNEGLWGPQAILRAVNTRCADFFCFSPYFTGGLRAFHRWIVLADLAGIATCKHTWGELGIAAAASHHVLLAAPSVPDGHQQTAQFLAEDVVVPALPIATEPVWGKIDLPGLGINVDEDRVRRFAADYVRSGEFPRMRKD